MEAPGESCGDTVTLRVGVELAGSRVLEACMPNQYDAEEIKESTAIRMSCPAMQADGVQ